MKPSLFFKLLLLRSLVIALCVGLAMPLYLVTPAMAAPGETITTPTEITPGVPIPPGFLFEPEQTIDSLKTVAQWNELEQLLDNPYAVILEVVPPGGQATPGNAQGYPSYTTDPAQFQRRRSYLPPGCTYQVPVPAGLVACNDAANRSLGLPQFFVHPLNYNPTTGEEMRLINPGYPGGQFDVPFQLVDTGNVNADGLPIFQWTYQTVDISAGNLRVQPGEPAIDYNSPMAPDNEACIITTEINPPEGSTLCGADPGEPNYGGFGSSSPTQYAFPAVPGIASPATPINPATDRLFDPTPDPVTAVARGTIQPRDPVTGAGGLRKPSLRVPEVGGTPALPNFAFNSGTQLAARAAAAGDVAANAPAYLAPSNENDYIAGATFAEKQAARDFATALGKALFWDMQVGSDGVQSCGSCHFKALVDDRTKNQLNPNHLGGDFTFQVARPNEDVVPGHFPFHKLFDDTIPGEPLLNPNNVMTTSNDVMSSMGVKFGKFRDIPVPGNTAFVGNTPGNPVMPDLRSLTAAQNVDPIPGFRGLRRVEPRNTPSLFSAAMNFDNFWDGRARHDFNGGSVFGASDPQSHVMADMGDGALQATRQIIRFSSLASLATGPALSNFEMSFDLRNWAKLGKKLLQLGVTPLANQLVDPTDSVLGPFSNFPNPGITVPPHPASVAGESGYVTLIRHAFTPQLWQNTTQHLNGAPAVCNPGALNGVVTPAGCDPFDGYVLSIDTTGPAAAANTNQFTQMEANFSLFWGLSIQTWGQILIPDDTPFDQFLDVNPDAFLALGEAGEPLLVNDLRSCGQVAGVRPCFTEFGNFKRDANLTARVNPFAEGGVGSVAFADGGTRLPGQPDPLLGTDIFHGTNLSLKNTNFRSARCGACHLGASLTDNNIERTHAISLGDFVAEFATPGVELILEPLGRGRLISGFLLESELNENGQDAIERFIGSQALIVNPTDGLAYPDGAFFLDNGVYNLGVTPTNNDISRGGPDPWGWPLSLATLMLKNLGGPDFEPGVPLSNFDPALGVGGGLFEETAQDQQINPGLEADPIDPLLPPHLGPWTNRLNVGNTHPEMDEVFGGLNTLTESPMLEGFVDLFGPFNPAGAVNEAYNSATSPLMGTWPVVNRVGRMGSFKAPQLRNVELTGPYFHNGGKLTLHQVIDFYARGGDFPVTNGGGVPCDATHTTPHPSNPGVCYDVATAHRDMMILNLREEIQSLGRLNDPAQAFPDGFTQEEALDALVDYLLELTDERVRNDQAPFDHPEVFIPLDGRAPENNFGRTGFLANLANGMFRQVPAVGAGGLPAAGLPSHENFLGVSSLRPTDPGFPAGGISHFDSFTGIVTQGVQIFAPRAASPGPVLATASQFQIVWGGPAAATNFLLQYSVNNGRTWILIASGVTGNTYNWTVPPQLGNKPASRIRVTALNAGGAVVGRAVSDPFTIEVVRLTSPNGGQVAFGGGTQAIAWTTNATIRPVAQAVLQYSLNGRTGWRTIATLASNPEFYNWTVPALTRTSGRVKVRVLLKDANGVVIAQDVSDAFFTISASLLAGQ